MPVNTLTNNINEWIDVKNRYNCLGRMPRGALGVEAGGYCWPPKEAQPINSTPGVSVFDSIGECDYYNYDEVATAPINDHYGWVNSGSNKSWNDAYVYYFEDGFTSISFDLKGAYYNENTDYLIFYRPQALHYDSPAVDCTPYGILTDTEGLIKCAGDAIKLGGWHTRVDPAMLQWDSVDNVLKLTINAAVVNEKYPESTDLKVDPREVFFNDIISCFTIFEWDSVMEVGRLSSESCHELKNESVVHRRHDPICDDCITNIGRYCEDCFIEFTCHGKQIGDNNYNGCRLPCINNSGDSCTDVDDGGVTDEFCSCAPGMSVNQELVCEEDESLAYAIYDDESGLTSLNQRDSKFIDLNGDHSCNMCNTAFEVASCSRCPLGGLYGTKSNIFPNGVVDRRSWNIATVPQLIMKPILPQCLDECFNIDIKLNGKEYKWKDSGNDLTTEPGGEGVVFSLKNLPPEEDAVYVLYVYYDHRLLGNKDLDQEVRIGVNRNGYDNDGRPFVSHKREDFYLVATFKHQLENRSDSPSILIKEFFTKSIVAKDYEMTEVTINIRPLPINPFQWETRTDYKLIIHAVMLLKVKAGTVLVTTTTTTASTTNTI